MGNILTICKKELNSYFRSPVAYGVMGFFALITGFFFYAAVLNFLNTSIRSAQMGQSQPMNVDEWVVRNVLSNISVICLFLIPMMTMRIFAEEKRSGTIELLVTSPLRDCEIIIGKWLGAVGMYAALLALSAVNMASLFAYGTPDWRPMAVGYLGLLSAGRVPPGDRNVHLKHHEEPNRRRGRGILRLPAAVGAGLGHGL